MRKQPSLVDLSRGRCFVPFIVVRNRYVRGHYAAPSHANRITASGPMPLAAPVTNITRMEYGVFLDGVFLLISIHTCSTKRLPKIVFYEDPSDPISMEKRYLTSDLSNRSYASLII